MRVTPVQTPLEAFRATSERRDGTRWVRNIPARRRFRWRSFRRQRAGAGTDLGEPAAPGFGGKHLPGVTFFAMCAGSDENVGQPSRGRSLRHLVFAEQS